MHDPDAKRFIFPKNFFWGSSTSAYQVEGGIENSDWSLAQSLGKVPVCGLACDHYNRFESDFNLAKDLGHTAHRFSFEWSRIEPKEGVFDYEALEHYRRVINSLKNRGLIPLPCLWHFTVPQWFAQMGGFEKKSNIKFFLRYANLVIEKLGVEIHHLTTMNEPIVFASNGWLRGSWPPFKNNSIINYFKVINNLTRAHRQVYLLSKKLAPHIEIALVKNTIVFDSDGGFFNKIYAGFMNWQWSYYFMNRVAFYCDLIGLNYYFYRKFGDNNVYNKSDTNWNLNPDKIYDALKILARYKKPLFVSEAGVADAKDKIRANYIEEQIKAVAKAIDNGIDVRGYLYWSLMDNYEWALGYTPRFGLIEINYENQERKIRQSALKYKEICQSNSVETNLISLN